MLIYLIISDGETYQKQFSLETFTAINNDDVRQCLMCLFSGFMSFLYICTGLYYPLKMSY